MTNAIGGPDRALTDEELRSFVHEQFSALDLDGRSLCLVIPDATRVCPLPTLIDAVLEAVRDRVRESHALIALGTHAPMSDDARRALVGTDELPTSNHEWWDDDAFANVGSLSSATMLDLSGGHLDLEVPIRINRAVIESDVTVIIGPVLPHEVVGFSGGNKYLFPGLSGQELIDVSHWLGALVTSREIIGTLGITPVRAVIDAAAAMVPGERHCLAVVTDRNSDGLRYAAFGDPQEAWAAAASVASRTHVTYLDRPVERVLSIVPRRYDDLWTGAKGFYKVEPVVADGGEVILYAPHITEISKMHPALLEIGYHCRDHFLVDWDRHRHHGWGELAHSTHLFGAGTVDSDGIEHQRVRVTLATGIPESVARSVNLGWADPNSIDVAEFERDTVTLVVHDAGEVLHRLHPS